MITFLLSKVNFLIYNKKTLNYLSNQEFSYLLYYFFKIY